MFTVTDADSNVVTDCNFVVKAIDYTDSFSWGNID